MPLFLFGFVRGEIRGAQIQKGFHARIHYVVPWGTVAEYKTQKGSLV